MGASMDASMDAGLTGRCYCGAVTFQTSHPPLSVVYCHCTDCRRWTGSPVSVFAGFDAQAVSAEPGFGTQISINPGVDRWHCPTCGARIAARYDYLPGQIYIPVGIFDQPSKLAPTIHAHVQNAVAWLPLDDGLPRAQGSARETLNAASEG